MPCDSWVRDSRGIIGSRKNLERIPGKLLHYLSLLLQSEGDNMVEEEEGEEREEGEEGEEG